MSHHASHQTRYPARDQAGLACQKDQSRTPETRLAWPPGLQRAQCTVGRCLQWHSACTAGCCHGRVYHSAQSHFHLSRDAINFRSECGTGSRVGKGSEAPPVPGGSTKPPCDAACCSCQVASMQIVNARAAFCLILNFPCLSVAACRSSLTTQRWPIWHYSPRHFAPTRVVTKGCARCLSEGFKDF